MKDFFGAGGVIVSLPLSVPESFPIVKCSEIRSLSHPIDVRPWRLSEAASPASFLFIYLISFTVPQP
jgi:hypothetical protein